MKILLFTPVAKISAIGRVSHLLTNEFRRLGHEVVIVSSQCGHAVSLPARDFGGGVIDCADEARILQESVNSFTIYQIGNNYDFHGGAIPWLRRVPGIVCLHDFYIAHLFNGWAYHYRAAAENVLRRWYGDGMVAKYFELARRATFIEDTVQVAPMTEWIASQALGVVTHSNWGLRRVKSSCVGLVRVVPLAYEHKPLSIAGQHIGRVGSDEITLLTVGHINTNKRAASVIRAIAASPTLRRRVTYRLVGAISPDTVLDLSALAVALRVRLVISGSVDDDALAMAFIEADIVSCLRWPTLEAASASAIEAMLYGKPTIVTNAGFYADIPDDCVEKVRVSDEVTEITAALERLQLSSDERHTLGSRAQRWAEVTFTAANYCAQVLDMAAAMRNIGPVIEAKAFFQNVISSWGRGTEALYHYDVDLPVRSSTDERHSASKSAINRYVEGAA